MKPADRLQILTSPPAPPVHRIAAIAGLLAGVTMAVLACGGGGSGGEGPAVGPQEGEHHPMVGQAAPDFIGESPDSGWLPLGNIKGKPIAILFFRPGAPFTRELATAFGRFREDSAMAPTAFLGIALDSMDNIRRFGTLTNGALPTLRDPGSITSSYGVGDAPSVILLDQSHLVRFRMDGFAGARFRERLDAVAEALRKLPGQGRLEAPAFRLDYTKDPKAPVFTAKDLDGRTVDLAALHGHAVVVIFFDQDCPHCKKDLPLLTPVLKEFRARGVRAIGVSSRDLNGGMRGFMKENGIDFPVVIDQPREIFGRFMSARTPDLFIIDPQGFIRFRERGERPDRAELTRLQLEVALGSTPQAALAKRLPGDRYSGDAVCAACHAREYQDWLLTPHSIAWDSLAQGDRFKDPECVKCHVTGMGKPGGFTTPEATLHMTNVQCEVCHGMGGGHAQGKGLDPEAIASACVGCHTGKFVLNFSIDEALPLVAHQDHPDLARLYKYSDLQRQRMEQINKRRLEKFKSGVAHVGADACRDCHRKEYDQWSATPHAAAFARLLQSGKSADPACLPCHTTGFGQKRGFGDSMATAEMTGVQCEVCHGPGDDHVKAPAALKKETIYGITDQCSFCIIQGVCATCHNAANDPHFSIEAALPKVKH